MKKNILFLLFVFYFSSLKSQVVSDAELKKQGYEVAERDCVLVEGEPPVLLSEIKKRAKQTGVSFQTTAEEFTDERLLWVYGRKQLKYDIPSIEKATEEHIKKIKESNGFTENEFEKALKEDPYKMTIRQFKLESGTAILANSVKQSIANQVSISDEQVRQEAGLRQTEMSRQFDVVFISVMSSGNASNVGKGPSRGLSTQFKKANEIKNNLTGSATINQVQKIYEHHKDVSIVGPIMYKKGSLNRRYEELIEKNPELNVIGPFEDKQAVSLMWKIKRPTEILDETALENLRKELYDKAVREKFKTETDALKNSSTVIVKGCQEP